MITLNICCAVITLAYAALMLLYRAGWQKQTVFSPPGNFNPKTRLSVIVPARNEAQNIAACVQSLIQQDYLKDLLEIIIVDDHSEDATADIAHQESDERIKVISLKPFLTETGTNAFKRKPSPPELTKAAASLSSQQMPTALRRPIG